MPRYGLRAATQPHSFGGYPTQVCHVMGRNIGLGMVGCETPHATRRRRRSAASSCRPSDTASFIPDKAVPDKIYACFLPGSARAILGQRSSDNPRLDVGMANTGSSFFWPNSDPQRHEAGVVSESAVHKSATLTYRPIDPGGGS